MDLKEILINASIDALILLGITAFIFNIFIAIKDIVKIARKKRYRKRRKLFKKKKNSENDIKKLAYLCNRYNKLKRKWRKSEKWI